MLEISCLLFRILNGTELIPFSLDRSLVPCHHPDICLQLAKSDTRLIQDATRLTRHKLQITILYGGEETNCY